MEAEASLWFLFERSEAMSIILYSAIVAGYCLLGQMEDTANLLDIMAYVVWCLML